MTILEINQAIRDCIRATVDEETGEITDESIDFEYLNKLELTKNEKVDNLISLYKEMMMMAEAVKAEKLALQKRQAQLEKKAESLKEYIGIVLDYSEKFESARNKVSFRSAPDTVEINCDVMELPEEYRKAEWKPTKKEIMAAIKAGNEVVGCALITGRTSTIIK